MFPNPQLESKTSGRGALQEVEDDWKNSEERGEQREVTVQKVKHHMAGKMGLYFKFIRIYTILSKVCGYILCLLLIWVHSSWFGLLSSNENTIFIFF